MSEDDLKKLKKEIQLLQKNLDEKSAESAIYKEQLIQFSAQLDQIISQEHQQVQVLNSMQKKLTPTELPQFPGFHISKKFVFGSRFGGDYFDVFEHEDKYRFGVLLASSSGYAMSALLLSLILKMTHIMEAKKGAAPSLVLKQISDELKTLANPKDQSQLMYGIIDRRRLTMNFCACGRILGFYHSAQKGLMKLSSTSSGLGAELEPTFNDLEIDLEPGSSLTFVTEGLMDILTPDDIAAEISSGSSHKSVHDIRNDILVRAQLKSGQETPLRDQTVVVIEVKENIIKLAKA